VTDATSFVLDLRKYKDRQGSRLPEGEYPVKVTDMELTKTKAGDPMVNVFLSVASGPQQGKTLMDRLVLSDNSLWRAVAFLKAVNVPTPVGKQLEIPFKVIIGKLLMISVEDGEPYPKGSSNIKSEIRGYAPAGGSVKSAPADLEDEVEETAEEPEPGEVAEEEAATKKKAAAEPEPPEDDDSIEVVDL
jgi:hypothetical protein